MDSQELQRLKNKFDIVGNDAGLNRAIETAVAVAPTDLTVLITGESGVGKENLPQIIHQYSRRRTSKYLAVNCGAIPEGTINAELFGHEKGAFTGAIGERKGYFEEADGGTLFLDEIGELPKETQALLLRVLQDGEYIKVGSSKVEKTDVRVVAATNVNLAYAVATGKFREDLYYRLSGIQISMPALRDRNKDDIYLLFRKFSSDFAEKYGLCKVSLSHEAINILTSYRWPGNIRQLKNIAQTVTALESKPAGASDRQHIISAIYMLKQEVDRLRSIVESGDYGRREASGNAPRLVEAGDEFHPVPTVTGDVRETEPEPEQMSIRKVNDDLIEKCLAKHGGKVKPAAAELGISERTIYRKLAEKKNGK